MHTYSIKPSALSPVRGRPAGYLDAPAPDVDWAGAAAAAPEQICSCSRGVLVHEGYMTGYLERTRGRKLRIERLWQEHDARRLSRSILLLDDQDHCHVVAQLSIFLQAFTPALKRQLIESNLPFGHVLDRAGIVPVFKDRRYFTLPQVLPDLDINPYRRCCRHFFGRHHAIGDRQGRALATVHEVLP